jgi:uncharacterized protein (DUF1800 family)
MSKRSGSDSPEVLPSASESDSAPTSPALSQTIARRGFLFRAAAVGMAAVAAPSLLAACEQVVDPTPTPMGTPFPTPTPFDAGAVTATPAVPAARQPTATPRATATATATPASAGASPTATATPDPALTPSPTPAPAPRAVLATEATRVSHLLRRASFGASKDELARFRTMGLQGTIDDLVDFDGVDDGELEARLASQETNIERQAHLQLWWLQRMAYSKRPLQEKMTLFWHGILTSSFNKTGAIPAMFEQNELFRRMGMGRYDEMLKAISRDAAMLIYLDSRTNRKAAPNENYSRELMELFTLGVGQYTEDDVREAARSFTGWQIKGKTEFLFNERQHDFGDKTFLDQTGTWDGDDVVDIIMQQPAAHEYIVRRLWEFFAYADPEPTVVARLVKVFSGSQTEIRPVMRAMFESDEFYSPRAFQGLIKGPAELVASTVRSLSIDTTFVSLRRGVEAMGQELLDPPDVSGWDGGVTWINSSTLLERVNLANAVSNGRSQNLTFHPGSLAGETAADSEALVDIYVDLLLGGEVADVTRTALVEHAEYLRKPTVSSGKAVPEDERQRSVVYLILASPDYQLA